MPRSPRYSRAHVSKPKVCESRSRGPSAWQACRYSCAIVPSGVRPCRAAYITLLVPARLSPRPSLQRDDHFLVPQPREAPARAVVGDPHAFHRRVLRDQRDLLAQPPAALDEVGRLLRGAEVDLVDDGEHRDLEQDRVQPRALDHDLDLAVVLRRRLDRDVLGVELEQPEEVDEVALDEPQVAQVREFLLAEAQRAQEVHLFADLVDVRR